MELMKVAERKRRIYDLLANDENKTVVLHGEPGVGKTWIAREMSRIVKRENLFDIVLWVYLNRYYNDDILSDSIAQQLSLLPRHMISRVEEDDEDDEESSKKKEVLKPEALVKNLLSKRILLVLDDEGNKMGEQKIRGMLFKLLKLDRQTYQVLVTTRNKPTDMGEETQERKYFEVTPMVRDDSLSLLKQRVFPGNQVENIDSLAEELLPRTLDMPNSIVIMAKAFKYFSGKEKGGAKMLRRSFEESYEGNIYGIIDLLRSGYDLLPYSVLIDCLKGGNGKKFFTDSHCINHNELIAYWIMEGYLGPISCMETAYRKGHDILMELLDFQILKRVEADYVTLNPFPLEKDPFDDFLLRRANKYYRHGYLATAFLGLDSVFGNVEWEGLVRLSQKGGVMRTLPSGRENVGVLLLDGNPVTHNLPKYVASLKKLQVLGLFNPTVDMLSHFKNDILNELHILVLKNCRFLNMAQVDTIKKFENLTVLEVSGPCSTSKFPDTFFQKMPRLQSLNFSSLPITKLPSSAYELVELKWLILRYCTSLESLNSLRNFKNLLVLDCSGSSSLKRIHDAKFTNDELKVINLSKTHMKILPLSKNLKKLTHLLLSECSSLNRLRSISENTSLEIVDLSNCPNFNEFFDQSIEQLGNLKILDLSGTSVNTIPKSVSNPRHLCLENCTQLGEDGVLECLSKVKDIELFSLSNAGIQSLPSISHLTNLKKLLVTGCLNLKAVPELSSLEKIEELDLSGCKMIKSIPDNTFDKMSHLQELNLSGTSIKSLPSLANLFDLRRLLLKDCEKLNVLSFIESKSLEKLEELNLRGSKALENIDSSFFDGTVNLHILDLSDAPLDKLPSLLRLINLHELYLRNCKGLKSVPDLEILTSLEILDLSGSAISDLPSLSNLSKLQKLMLGNCSALSLFRKTGTLDLLGYRVQDLPYGISDLPSLEHLVLPRIDDVQGDDKSDGCEWCISSFSANVSRKESGPFLSIPGTQFVEPLVKDKRLWESYLKKFDLSVYPMEELDAIKKTQFQGNDFVFRDIYTRSKHFREFDDRRLLEVCGFRGHKPEGIDEVFGHANQFSFVDSRFEEHNEDGKITETWPSFLAACKSDQIYELWIQNCRDIDVIFSAKEKEKILGLINSVKTLWVSNATSLKSIYSEVSKGKIPEQLVFQNLESLYLECCPKLTTAISLSQLPKKLKTLHIKFCDNLTKVFETSQGTTLQCLETLHLQELQILETVGCQMPSLKTVKVSNCPKLQNMQEIIRLAQNLESLSISNVPDLKTIGISKGLEYLSIDSCQELVEIVASSNTTFEEIKLESLHLHGLRKLRTIDAALPDQSKCFITDCLNLQY